MAVTRETYPNHELTSIAWVKSVRASNREGTDLLVQTRRSILRESRERHQLQNMGYVVESYASGVANPEGLSIYVSERPPSHDGSMVV